MLTSQREKQAALLLAVTMLCFAANHVIGRGVHGEMPPLGLSFWRWLIGAVIIFPFVAPGLGQAVTNTSLINATQPSITALLCWIFLRDWPSCFYRRRLLSITWSAER